MIFDFLVSKTKTLQLNKFCNICTYRGYDLKLVLKVLFRYNVALTLKTSNNQKYDCFR